MQDVHSQHKVAPRGARDALQQGPGLGLEADLQPPALEDVEDLLQETRKTFDPGTGATADDNRPGVFRSGFGPYLSLAWSLPIESLLPNEIGRTKLDCFLIDIATVQHWRRQDVSFDLNA